MKFEPESTYTLKFTGDDNDDSVCGTGHASVGQYYQKPLTGLGSYNNSVPTVKQITIHGHQNSIQWTS